MSTNSEIDSGVSDGKAIARVISTNGAFSYKRLTKASSYSESSCTPAQFRDWQRYDSGVFDDIWVRTAASSPQSVSYTGSPTVTTSGGKTSYAYSGGTYNGSRLIRGLSEDSAITHQQAGATIFVDNFSTGSIRKPANPTSINGSIVTVKNNNSYPITVQAGGTARGVFTLVRDNSYDCTTWADYTTLSSYTYGAYYASSGSSGGGGTVTVTPYTPETVSRKVFQPESYTGSSYTEETTTNEKYNYYTYVPSSGTPTTKNFLVPSAATATQNFAFDMDDYE